MRNDEDTFGERLSTNYALLIVLILVILAAGAIAALML